MATPPHGGRQGAVYLSMTSTLANTAAHTAGTTYPDAHIPSTYASTTGSGTAKRFISRGFPPDDGRARLAHDDRRVVRGQVRLFGAHVPRHLAPVRARTSRLGSGDPRSVGPAREIIRRIRGGHEQSAIVSAKCMYSNQRRHRGRMIDIELQVQTGGSGAGDTVYMYDRHILVPRPRFSIIYRGNITEATLLRRRPHLQHIASEPRPRPCA